MIHTLKIKNFAIIKEAQVSFEKGFNVLTGETGAGKSMIVDAISILLGAKPKTEDIRTGENEAVLEGFFSGGKMSGMTEILGRAGIDVDDDEVIIRRVISRNGKNKNYVNGSLTNQTLLYETGKYLVDICAQNENRILMNPQYHIDILDEFAQTNNLKSEYKKSFDEYCGLVKKRTDLETRNIEALKKADYLKFVVKEIEELDLKEGEEEELRVLRKRLQNSEKIKDITMSSYNTLYSMDGSTLETIKTVSKNFASLNDYDPKFEKYSAMLDEIGEKISDISFDVKTYLDDLDFEPGKLEEVEERLHRISKVVRKYGSVPEALKCSEEFKKDLDVIENFDHEINKIDKDISSIAVVLKDRALKLSKERKKKSKDLESSINNELKSLNMEGASFFAKISDLAEDSKKDERFPLENYTVSPKGKDEVSFLLTANVGEEAKPLEFVASLGELSRIMLALKLVFYSKNSYMNSFIFDEIDTGIGGKVAEMVGRKLGELSKGNQVICVTHLSQIASYADHHYFISKRTEKGRTVFETKKLNANGRKEEIARMIGGLSVTKKTKALAEELLSKSSKEINA